jgi:hypothetical protein
VIGDVGMAGVAIDSVEDMKVSTELQWSQNYFVSLFGV